MNENLALTGARLDGPLYLAGPMTGIPQFNFPLFIRVTARLRQHGFDIVSPAELDDEDGTAEIALASTDGLLDDVGKVNNNTWGDLLARDVKLIADKCKGIILLPGWQNSKGAKLEAFVNILCDFPFFEVAFDEVGNVENVYPIDKEYVLTEIYHVTN